eukprot:CAMPEP_0118923622 /NCGR_PEP_ID=MMETSP1169-20130426/2076_1 /TAXON_ID=36882 /ORGANISM="Pyramimonas obovata, Strain CCMP722" /LENGTH=173 /DNA_ID=CAMNT_0006864635 /DNA_START=103 /DNA_END=624 /DNA_ORIENTATION=+
MPLLDTPTSLLRHAVLANPAPTLDQRVAVQARGGQRPQEADEADDAHSIRRPQRGGARVARHRAEGWESHVVAEGVRENGRSDVPGAVEEQRRVPSEDGGEGALDPDRQHDDADGLARPVEPDGVVQVRNAEEQRAREDDAGGGDVRVQQQREHAGPEAPLLAHRGRDMHAKE